MLRWFKWSFLTTMRQQTELHERLDQKSLPPQSGQSYRRRIHALVNSTDTPLRLLDRKLSYIIPAEDGIKFKYYSRLEVTFDDRESRHKEAPSSLLSLRKKHEERITVSLYDHLVKLQEEIHCQVVSIFLFNDTGNFACADYYGFNLNGAELFCDFLKSEICFVDNMSSDMAHLLNQDCKSIEISGKTYAMNNKSELESLCGPIGAVLLSPLRNGKKLLGFIRVFSKHHASNNIYKEADSLGDELIRIADRAAKIRKDLITINRKRNEELILFLDKSLKTKPNLSQHEQYSEAFETIYSIVCDLAIGEHCGIVLASLRLRSHDGRYMVTLFESRKQCITPKDSSPRSLEDGEKSVVAMIYKERGHYYEVDLPSAIDNPESIFCKNYSLINGREWIASNNIKGLYCTALRSGDDSFGSLALFTGHSHIISTEEEFNHFRAIGERLSKYISSVFDFSLPAASQRPHQATQQGHQAKELREGERRRKTTNYDKLYNFIDQIETKKIIPDKIKLESLEMWIYHFAKWGLEPDSISASFNTSETNKLRCYIKQAFKKEVTYLQEQYLARLLLNTYPDENALLLLELFAGISIYPLHPDTNACVIEKLNGLIKGNSINGNPEKRKELLLRVKRYEANYNRLKNITILADSGSSIDLIRVMGKRNTYQHSGESSPFHSCAVLLGIFRGDSYYKVLSSQTVHISSLNDYVDFPSRARNASRSHPSDEDYLKDAIVINVSQKIRDKILSPSKANDL